MIFYGAAYYPEQTDPSQWEGDLDRMAQANLNALRVGEFAWCFFEPREGHYDFGWMDRFRDLAWKRGIGLLMCPPLRTLPAWFASSDPSMRIVRDDGVTLEYGSRYSFCINHPSLRERGAALAAAMVRHYGRDPAVVGWHLDNEHGDEPDCHCPLCRAMFQIWCERKYRDIAKLNQAWGLSFWGLAFDRFDQVPTPRATKTYHSPGHTLDWRRFRSECTVEAMQVQADEIRPRRREGQFITTNNQALWNPRTDYYQMARSLEVAGTNYYPPYGPSGALGTGDGLGLAMCRSYQGGRPFQIHELRCGAHVVPGRGGNTPAPGEVARLALHGLGHGANGLFFFRWRGCTFGAEQAHGSIADYEGKPSRIFPEVARVGAWIDQHKEWLETSRVVAKAAVLMDFQTRWTFEGLGPEWGAPRGLYNEQAIKILGAIRRTGLLADATSRWDDWSRYALLAVPTLASCDDEVAAKLAAYVRNGGTLVMQAQCGWKDADSQIHPGRMHPWLRELVGFELDDFATLDPSETTPFEWNGVTYRGHLFADLPKPDGLEPEGTFSEGWFKGRGAVVRRTVASGSVIWVGTYAERAFFVDLFRTLATHSGISPVLSGIPDDVEALERVTADHKRLVFLLSGTDQSRVVPRPFPATDLWTDAPAPDEILLPPHGVSILLENRA